ncbi:MAG: Hsp20/alpha crystallin family protein [Bacteroidota bacterium]
MTLVKWNNRNVPALSNLFEDFFNENHFNLIRGLDTETVPAVNIKETDSDYIVEVAAPGFEKKDFNVHVNNNQLLISSEKEAKNEEKDEHFTKREFSCSSFHRTFTLPEIVKADKITAKYDNGILKLVIPKIDEAVQKFVMEIKIS